MAKDKEVAVVEPEKTGLDAEPPSGLNAKVLYSKPVKPAEPEKVEKAESAKKPAVTDKSGKDDKPKGEPEPVAVSDEQQKAWDEERQRRDQGHSNERKALEGQIGLLSGQVSGLKAQLETATKVTLEDDVAKQRLAAVERLTEQVEGIDGESDPAAVAAALRSVGGLMREFATTKPVASVDKSQVVAIVERLDRMEAGLANVAVTASNQASQAELERTLKDFDKEFGAQYRNDAVKEAKAVLGTRGFTADEPPTPFETELVLRNAYMNAKAGEKKPGDMPKGDAGVLPGDTGSGGNTTPLQQGERGTLEDVLADMQAKGQVRE